MKTSELIQLYETFLMNNYGPRGPVLVVGRGCRVWDNDGKEYLDFIAGISVCNLGHCCPKVVEAIQEQSQRLIHCSNLYYIPNQILLAQKLCSHSFADRVLLIANSGAI